MAPLRFSANVSWLFSELPGLPARLRAAGSSGFEAAEVGWPYGEPPEALARAAREVGLQLVLINTPPGDREKGEMGLGAVPGRQAAFRDGLEQAVLYAKALGCPRIHLMAGRVPQGADRAAVRGEMETVFLENLRHAAGVLAQGELYSWIPPGARRTLWGCWNPSTPASRTPAAAILEKVGRPNLQLQMDIFHWQIMDGNLTGNIREFLPFVGEGPFLGFFLVCHAASSVLPLFLPPHICPHLPPGHVQVAQVPGRGEPSSPGELNFPYLFQLLEDEGYKGFVGCEYQPRGDTVEGLSWLRSYWDKRGRPQAGQ
ncbi:putative hydroxypyruvate isomerase isoform X1 [Balaenoptera ricei]|uniref:putative hydroxypyruvate isomerase isoform X1 n=1 Tax=Balaenoptera ricei TaxID=2746895 RepID=UPI0028BE5B94|nr:putative hydroxypyruvate isomerase isoform X1 [Balaenoptera ricei]